VYQVFYSNRAAKSFKKIPKNYQIKIKEKIAQLSKNPYIPGTVKLVSYPTAQLRHRVGDYRVLFSLDEKQKMLIVVDIRRRTTTTYS